MNQRSIPFALVEGARLTNTMIPWGTPFADLSQFGSPQIKQMSDSRHFTWSNVSFLGLIGDARACLMHRRPENKCMHRDAYHLFLPDFHSISIVVEPLPDTSVEMRLRSTFVHMKSQFGLATFCYPVYTQSLPSFFWELENLFLSCYLHYGGDTACVDVRHYTDEHRQELATFDPPTRGARSDEVKWNELW